MIKKLMTRYKLYKWYNIEKSKIDSMKLFEDVSKKRSDLYKSYNQLKNAIGDL